MTFPLAFDNRYYYDTGFQIGELRHLDKPYNLVLEKSLSSDFLSSGGGFHLTRFADVVADFFAYFVNGSFFEVEDVVDRINIPQEGSFDYTMNGDVYVRRFGPFALLCELDSLKIRAVSPHQGLDTSLLFALNNGLLSSSMAFAVRNEIPTYCSLRQRREGLLALHSPDVFEEESQKPLRRYPFEVIEGGKK